MRRQISLIWTLGKVNSVWVRESQSTIVLVRPQGSLSWSGESEISPLPSQGRDGVVKKRDEGVPLVVQQKYIRESLKDSENSTQRKNGCRRGLDQDGLPHLESSSLGSICEFP